MMSIGFERILWDPHLAEQVFPAPRPDVDVFVVDVTGGLAALGLGADLRAAGISSDRAYEQRSMKSQMKAADRSGARLALIVGGNELASGTVTLRPLAGRAGDDRTQTSIPRTELIDTLKRALQQ